MAKVDFKALKEKVGIDDIAYSMGYRVNRKAGVGKYLDQDKTFQIQNVYCIPHSSTEACVC